MARFDLTRTNSSYHRYNGFTERGETMSLFATKPIERILSESEGGEHTLKRTLGASSLIALGIGAIIGAGLFSLTGLAAAQYAGPAVGLSVGGGGDGCGGARFVCQRILPPVSGRRR